MSTPVEIRSKSFSFRRNPRLLRSKDNSSCHEMDVTDQKAGYEENLPSISSENEVEECLERTTPDSGAYTQPSSPTSKSSSYDRRPSCFPEQSRSIWRPEDIISSLRSLSGCEVLWNAFEVLSASTEEVKSEGLLEEELMTAFNDTVSAGHGDSALLLTACHCRPDLIQRLLDEGVQPCVVDGKGRTPLHLACYFGDEQSAAILIEYGGDISTWDYEKKATPIHFAAISGSRGCMKLLLDAGADVNASADETPTPLYHAVQMDSPECVKELLEAGAITAPQKPNAASPLHVAASYGYSKCLRLLLEWGADANCKAGRSGTMAIHLAAKDENPDCTKVLLDFGADLRATNIRLQTPLHLAALSQSSETLELLLTSGSDFNAVDVDMRTPLHCAIVKGSRCTECVRLLLAKGCNVNCADIFGYTPLHLAALNEFSTCVGLLLRAGADVMARTKGGVSALTFVVRRTPDTVSKLLERLDSSVTLFERDLGDADCEILLDFRPLLPPVPPPSTPENKYYERRNESSLLLGLVEVGIRSLLEHPLCETFLFLKWRRTRKFFLISLCYHLIFITFYTTYIIGVFSRDPGVYGNNQTSNGTRKCVSEVAGNPFSKTIDSRIIAVGYMVMIMNLASMAKEVFQIAHGSVKYFQNWENWLQWVIIVSVFLSHGFRSISGAICELYTFQHHVAALATVFIWADLMIQIGRYPTLGVYVQMFTTVSVNFSKLLLAYSCLLVGFGLGLGVLLPNFPAFEQPHLALLTSVIMMSGELEYESIFFNKDRKILFKGTSHIMILAFVLLMTVILTNLLVGLAVSDIQGLRKTARLNRLVRETENIAHLESILFSRSLHKIVPTAILKPCLNSALLVPSAPYNMSMYLRPNDPREKRVPRHLLDAAYNLVVIQTTHGKDSGRGKRQKVQCHASKYSFKHPGESRSSIRLLRKGDSLSTANDFREMDGTLQQVGMLNYISSQLSMVLEESKAKSAAMMDIKKRLIVTEKSVNSVMSSNPYRH